MGSSKALMEGKDMLVDSKIINMTALVSIRRREPSLIRVDSPMENDKGKEFLHYRMAVLTVEALRKLNSQGKEPTKVHPFHMKAAGKTTGILGLGNAHGRVEHLMRDSIVMG